MAFAIQAPYENFTGLDGLPLTAGYVYIGVAGLDPITNPVPIFWDEAMTIAATQPLRTNAGYIVRLGTPARVYTASNYSITVNDVNNITVFYTSNFGIVDYQGANGASYIGGGTQNVKTIAELRLLKKTSPSKYALVAGYYQAGDGGGGAMYYYDASDAVSADNGGSVIVASDGGRWKLSNTYEISVAQFGAKGDGVADDTSAIRAARLALPAGGRLVFGAGTFIVSTDTCLRFDVANISVRGQGSATIIKAKSGANLKTLVFSSAVGFSISELVLDGNRSGSGTSSGPDAGSTSYMLFLSASECKVSAVELRFASAIAMFLGSSTVVPSGIIIKDCWIHDNGGSFSGGFGVGIFGGGTFLPDCISITQCRIERNYCTFPGAPGDSTAVNINCTDIVMTNNFIRDNHNVDGGQICLVSGADSTGLAPGRYIVSDNLVLHTVAVAGELTSAIEVAAHKVSIVGNVVQSLNADGIRLESTGGATVVSGNVCDASAVGINVIAAGGTGVDKVLITGNSVLTATVGISVQAGVSTNNMIITNNFINPSIGTKINGASNCILIRDNFSYNPGNQLSLGSGPSPYSFPVLNFDAVYSCQTVNGMTGANLNGVNVSIAAFSPIFVKAGSILTVTWSGTSPIFSVIAQQ